MGDTILYDGVTQWRFTSISGQMAGTSASAFLSGDGVLIDTGFAAAHSDFTRLLDSNHVRGVIVTHHHEDHAGHVEIVAARGLPLQLDSPGPRANRVRLPTVHYFSARNSAAVNGVVREARRARTARTWAALTGAARLPHCLRT